MNHLQRCLIIPAIFGTISLACNSFFVDIEHSPMAAIFSLMMAFWGFTYVCLWRQHSNGLEYKWDVYKIAKENAVIRKDFYGTKKYDPITDRN
jgi:hypothetical protein